MQDLPLSEGRKLSPAILDVEPLPPPRTEQHITRARGPKRVPDKYDVTRIGSRGIGGGINFYSVERERELGRELALAVEGQVRMVSDPVVNEYVNRLAQNLVRHSDAVIPFTVKLADNDEVNAFTLPGGYLYVNSGLLLAAQNEAELAGVMAHEIAHAAARHATKNETRRQLFNLASIPLTFVSGGAATVIAQAADIAGPISFMKFSRNAEREADVLGLEYAYAAGYDPIEFVNFLERTREERTGGKGKQEKASFLTKVFATHPMTDDRIRRAQDAIATMLPPKELYVITTSEFDEIKRRLAQVRSGERTTTAEIPVLRRRGPGGPPRDDDRNNDPGP